MRVNLENLTKEEILRMATWKCPLPNHGRHTGLEHPNCYTKLIMHHVREGYFDIETFGSLNADYGILLAWNLKKAGVDEFYEDHLLPSDVKIRSDRRVMKSLCEALPNFDVIYTYYGLGMDIPLAKAKAIHYGLSFPLRGQVRHIDLYSSARSNLLLSSRRLENLANYFNLGEKTRLDADIWMKAVWGDEVAMGYIIDHNKKDTILLEKFHELIEPYRAKQRRYI